MRPRELVVLILVVFVPALSATAREECRPAAEAVTFVRQGDIWVAKTDGTGERQLTHIGACGGPALSPDGKQVAFHCRGDQDLYPDTGFGRIYLVDTAGCAPKPLRFKGILAAEHPSFSPDGGSLVFVGLSEVKKKGKGEAVQVFATTSVSIGHIQSGKVQTVLRQRNMPLDTGYVYSNPAFSPDGKRVLWQHSGSDVSGGFAITDLKGETLLRFPANGDDPTPYWGASLAPDGQTVLCYTPATSDASNDTIYGVNSRTGKSVEVTKGASPVFVRNGKAIVFERWTNRWSEKASSNLWILELNTGASPKRIITDASEPAGPMLRR